MLWWAASPRTCRSWDSSCWGQPGWGGGGISSPRVPSAGPCPVSSALQLVTCSFGTCLLLVSPLTPALWGFCRAWGRFCLENTDPRTRGRGIQLLSQVLLECHSLLQEKEGKGCSAPHTGCWRAGGPESLSCTQQTGCFSTVAALRASLKGQSPRRTRGLTLQPVCHPPDVIWAWLCSWCPRQCVGVAYPGVLSATWEASGTHLHVRIPAW